MRDMQGRYIKDDEITAIDNYLIGFGARSPIVLSNIEVTDEAYKVEFIEYGKRSLSYLAVPVHWVKSFIRDKKINTIIG